MADGVLAQEAENIHLSDSYLISGGHDPLISNNVFANTFSNRGHTTGACVPGASLMNIGMHQQLGEHNLLPAPHHPAW